MAAHHESEKPGDELRETFVEIAAVVKKKGGYH
jgi:hypothetical protein